TRFLAVQPQSDASIIFVKTRALTLEVSDKLATAGFRVAPLNGDLSQSLREQTIEFLKSGKIDIIVATDVAARGLDVERVSQVINFDLPPDMEAYLHRIGRTGRAGRSGSALLLLSERQTPFLDKLERFTKHKLQQVDLPSSARITEQRTLLLKEKVLEYCEGKDVKFFKSIVQEIVAGSHFGIDEIAAAFCYLAQVQAPLRMSDYDDSKVAPMLAETERFAEKKQRRNRGRGRRSEGHHASGGRKRQRGRRRAV
ncbi:MAG: hypothetical protein KDD62_06400, partial [Bdellovibrionales bacterium]|nr:hypothetical protein [Bdellovibrionales bacterium]